MDFTGFQALVGESDSDSRGLADDDLAGFKVMSREERVESSESSEMAQSGDGQQSEVMDTEETTASEPEKNVQDVAGEGGDVDSEEEARLLGSNEDTSYAPGEATSGHVDTEAELMETEDSQDKKTSESGDVNDDEEERLMKSDAELSKPDSTIDDNAQETEDGVLTLAEEEEDVQSKMADAEDKTEETKDEEAADDAEPPKDDAMETDKDKPETDKDKSETDMDKPETDKDRPDSGDIGSQGTEEAEEHKDASAKDVKDNQDEDDGGKVADGSEALRSRLLEDPIDKEVGVDKDDLLLVQDDAASSSPARKKKYRTPKMYLTAPSSKPIQEKWLRPFEQGWARELVLRNTYDDEAISAGKKMPPSDVYYFTPTGNKLRSMPGIIEYLQQSLSDLTSENFTFLKQTIYREPFETVRHAGKSKRKTSKPLYGKKHKHLGSPRGVKRDDSPAKSTPTPSTPATPADDSQPSPSLASPDLKPASPVKVVKTQQVAKKKTGARRMITSSLRKALVSGESVKRPSDGEIRPVVIKKYKAASVVERVPPPKPPVPAGPVKLCGLTCEGIEGIPPTLLCNMCLCLFHPECVNYHGSTVGMFTCPGCRGEVNGFSDSGNKTTSISSPVTSTPSSSTAITSAGSQPPIPLSVSALNGDSKKLMIPAMPALRPGPIIKPVTTGVKDGGTPPAPPMLIRAPGTSTTSVRTATPIITPKAPATPLNNQQLSGQLLTLPANIATKLDPDAPLAVKMNGQSLLVPPNCVMHTPQGLKVFLPAGTLPVSSSANLQMNISFQSQKVIQSGDNSRSGVGMQTLTMQHTQAPGSAAQRAASSGTNSPAAQSQSPKPVAKRTRKTTPCHIHRLHAGFDCMLYLFNLLPLRDLLRAAQVCKTWSNVASHRSLWHKVRLQDTVVTDWEAAATKLEDMGTTSLDLRGLEMVGDPMTSWQQFLASLEHLHGVRKLHLCKCPSLVLHSLAESLPFLTDIAAEAIANLSQTEQECPPVTLDIGKLSRLKYLKTLKLRGTKGLSLPTFSFSGGVMELANLTQLTSLSLTSLRGVAEEEFALLESLTELQTLEIGECRTWTSETFKRLAKMVHLRKLRLEYGGVALDGSALEQLKQFTSLETLELIKFPLGEGLEDEMHKFEQLKSLSIWPQPQDNAADINTNVLKSVAGMNFLTELQWGVLADMNHNNKNGEDGEVGHAAQQGNCIPLIQTPPTDDVNTLPEYVSVKQLLDRLRTNLPDTKLRLFLVMSSGNSSDSKPS